MRRTARLGLVAAIAAAGLWGPALGASAATAAPNAAGPVTAEQPVKTTTVTLVTGDVITVSTAADGKVAYSAEPAPGSTPGTVLTRTDINGDTYFYPSDVIGQVGRKLDPRLFNVSALVRDGYDDKHRASLPLIVQNSADSAKDSAAKTTGTPLKQTRTFPSLRAHAATLDKDDADHLGARLDKGLSDVSRIWLDGKTKADALDRNLSQIKAPEAWAAGASGAGVKVAVLDTGADPDHPDLKGRISTSADFSGSGSPVDHHGHGTHVAATVAGSGAGAVGLRSGVAPKADLLVGKVLGDSGEGSDSQVIAGMEWAVAQGARVVSMSLGAGPSDGTDPVSAALQKLSTESGALFVVAAGNAGPGVGTVAAPSVAPAALSVAAVDYSNSTASFSSRGPAMSSAVVKPEIAAPGVNIVAARAAGTDIGTVQADPDYTALSGTSMATPQVAGVAALLAQEHPDWHADRLKSALMGSAAKLPQSVYETGAGLADAAAALKTRMVADTTAVNFGRVAEDGTAEHTVTFTNTGDSAQSVNLAAAMARPGATDQSGLVKVSPSTLTVPAGGTARATVSVDTTGTPSGTYSGALTATPATGPALRVPLVLDRAQTVTISALGRSGEPVSAGVTLLDMDNGTAVQAGVPASGKAEVRVPDGRFLALATVSMKIDGVPAIALMAADKAADDKEIVFDARTARPWNAEVRGFETRNELLVGNLSRRTPDGEYFINHSIVAGGGYGPFGKQAIWISPTAGLAADTVATSEHRRLANADSDHLKGDARTMFDLTFTGDEVPADPTHRLTRADVAKLARVDATYRALNGALRTQEGDTVYGDDLWGLNTTSPSFVATPRVRTEYYSATGRQWWRLLYRRADQREMDYDFQKLSYENGDRLRQDWFTAPYTVRTTGTVTGGRLQIAVADAVDSQGRQAEYSDFTYPQSFKGSTTLYRDGEQVVTGNSTKIDKTFADGPADYRLERTFTSAGAFPVGGEAKGTWTFRTQGGAQATPASLMNVSFNARLDLYNRARADRPLAVRAKVTGAEGRISGAKAWVTGDGGATWQPAPAVPVGKGTYEVLAPARMMQHGAFLGVRLSASDAAGSSVDLSLPRALPVG